MVTGNPPLSLVQPSFLMVSLLLLLLSALSILHHPISSLSILSILTSPSHSPFNCITMLILIHTHIHTYIQNSVYRQSMIRIRCYNITDYYIITQDTMHTHKQVICRIIYCKTDAGTNRMVQYQIFCGSLFQSLFPVTRQT